MNILIAIVILILAILLLVGNSDEGFNRYDALPYQYECEFQPDCLWDTARWVQMSNGMEGVCTLQGLACPAFSKDHDTSRYMGLSPTMVSDNYMKEIHNSEGFCEGDDCDIAGATALQLL